MGYGSFPLDMIEFLWRAKQPYNVSVASEVAACAALTNMDYLNKVGVDGTGMSQRLDAVCKAHAGMPVVTIGRMGGRQVGGAWKAGGSYVTQAGKATLESHLYLHGKRSAMRLLPCP